MVNIQDLVQAFDKENVKELILAAGARPAIKIKQGIEFLSYSRLKPEEVKNILLNLQQRSKLVNQPLAKKGQFSVGISGVGRLQVFYSLQRGSYLLIIKRVKDMPPFLRELLANISDREKILSIFKEPFGFILIQSASVEPAKDFIASILTYLSRYSNFVIHTIEDPITYTLKHEQSLVIQTEVGEDVSSIEEGIQIARILNPNITYISKLTNSRELKELLSLIEMGNMVILPFISASLQAAMLSIERLADDAVLARNIISFFIKTCITLKEVENNKVKVEITKITEECKRAIREGDYSKLTSNG